MLDELHFLLCKVLLDRSSFAKLHMGYMLETFYPGRFGLIASEDHGKCFDYCPGSSDSQHPVYNIAMTPDGQLQLALS